MISNVNNPSFGSTIIHYDKTPLNKYVKPLNKYFEVKGFKLMKPQQAADKLDFSKAAVMFDKKNGNMIIVGKNGGAGGTDTIIGKILKEINPNAKYIDDVEPLKVDGPVIDLDI